MKNAQYLKSVLAANMSKNEIRKIAHIQVLPKMSGAQQVSYEIFRGLDSGWEKTIVCGKEGYVDKYFEQAFERAGARVIFLDYLKREIGIHDFYAFISLYKLFKKERFDIVHTHSTKPGVIARIAARLAGVPFVIHTVHGIAFHKFIKWRWRIFFYFIEAIAISFGHVNVLVNKSYCKYYKYIPKANVRTIYNGVDFLALDNNCSLRPANEPIRILFMARIDEQKDPVTLLKACRILLDEKNLNKSFELLVAGDGDLKIKCKHLVSDLRLEKHVKFLGWVTDKSKILCSVDILCIPSIYEAFGLIFVEAGYFSVPAVSTLVEGIPEVIIDGSTGLLVPPCDAQSLAAAIATLINNDDYRSWLGKNAKQSYMTRFDVKTMQESYRSLYDAS